MVEPTQRRATSELDISSMRRISDALLLAQNRARRATDRANRAEHVLRLVLTQVDVSSLRIHSSADYEVLQATVNSSSLGLVARPRRRSSVVDVIEPKDTISATSSESSRLCFKEIAKNVVTNLNIAMTHHRRYVDQLTFPTLHLWLWRHKMREMCDPVQLMIGFLAGVLFGVVVTEQWQMQLMRTQRETLSLCSKVATWCSRRAPVHSTPWHLIPLPMDECNYLMHPETVEVV